MSTPLRKQHRAKKTSRLRRGGTIINVIVAVIFFGLLGMGVWWVIKGWGQAMQEYTGVVIDAKDSSMELQCKLNLRTIHQNLRIYALTNEEFPPSAEKLRQWSGSSRLLRCPARDGADYIYIPGQSSDMAGTNILIFEPNAVHDGLGAVLRLSGAVEMLSPEELRQAIKQTEAEMASGRR